ITRGDFPLGLARGGKGFVRKHELEAVQLPIALGDAVKRLLRQLDRGDLACAQARRDLGERLVPRLALGRRCALSGPSRSGRGGSWRRAVLPPTLEVVGDQIRGRLG